MQRSGKFYRKNEAEVMKMLGLKPTINSGSTWLEKEDGVNDYVICQLKSTDAQSIRVQQKDIRMLEKNALIEHKIPMFAIQFLNTSEVWLMVKPEHISEISDYLNCKQTKDDFDLGIEIVPELDKETRETIYTIKSSSNAKEEYKKEQEEKYKKIRSAK